MTNTTTTASETFDRMEQDERWLGHGYLGTRRNALDTTDREAPAQPEMVQRADELALSWMYAHRWNAERMFKWANSKDGRYYGDAMFGGTGTADERFAVAVKWGVLR